MKTSEVLGQFSHQYNWPDLFLGVVLYDNSLLHEHEWLQIRPEMFQRPVHQKLWAVMAPAGAEGKLVCPIWLSQEMSDDPDFEAAGGVRYLADLVDAGSEVRDLQKGLLDAVSQMLRGRPA
jgi:replicative DNA helicase